MSIRSVIPKGLEQHPVKPELGRITKTIDADQHVFVARLRLGAIGAK